MASVVNKKKMQSQTTHCSIIKVSQKKLKNKNQIMTIRSQKQKCVNGRANRYRIVEIMNL